MYIIVLVFIVLDVGDRIESKYPSIIFLSIYNVHHVNLNEAELKLY